MMRIDIISLFPEYFESPLNTSMLKRAREANHIDLHLHNIREFATGKHQIVDDRPYGGGPGMVLKPEPLVAAIQSVKSDKSHVIYLSPQGEKLVSRKCRELANYDHLILVCGHYEGIDQRVIETEIDEEVSIGDYILTNGCLASIVLLDSVVRFIPGVLGNEMSAEADCYDDGMFGPPQYTRPENFNGLGIPEVLKSGNHAEIEKWRAKKSRERACARDKTSRE